MQGLGEAQSGVVHRHQESAVPEVGHQISTLPLEATRVEYTFRTDAADGTVTLGKITLWAEGFFVKGFLELIEEDGLPWPFRDWRLLQDGGLRLASYVSGQISGRSVD